MRFLRSLTPALLIAVSLSTVSGCASRERIRPLFPPASDLRVEPKPQLAPADLDSEAALDRHDIEIAIVSDFHVDLRPYFASLGILDYSSGFAISYEVGAVKPDRRMFDAALNAITSPAHRCLMMGDNLGPDTGAAALGITTLIVPVERVDRPALLHRITALAALPI